MNVVIAKPRAAFASVRDAMAQMGTLNGLLYVASRALERATGGRARVVKYLLVAQPVGRAGAPVLRPDPSTEIAVTAPDDPVVAAFPRPAHVIRARFAMGATCFTATVRGEFAGFIWLQRGQYAEDEVRCTYVLPDAARSAWDFDVYVVPRFRLGRTLARLWQAVDAHCAAEGVAWSFSRISAFNPASLAAHARLGAARCADASFLVAGPVQLALLPSAPFVHLSLRAGSVPTLHLATPASTRTKASP